MWLQQAIKWCADLFPQGVWLHSPVNLKALVAVILVSVICGAVGSLVVGNRMAFFSDALAHCAFAGVALGMLMSIFTRGVVIEDWLVPLVMVVFGALVGVAIAYVREKTALASDTVIGVFFALAVGFGGMLIALLRRRTFMSLENFLFGSVFFIHEYELLSLAGLAVVTGVVLGFFYNHFVIAGFNPSLARSRQVPVRLCNYVLIVLLAVIVNLCLRAVGALLINALLVVPAATAANLARNLRQMFWICIGLTLVTSVVGVWLSATTEIPLGANEALSPAPAGTIVVLNVILFFAAMAWRRRSAV